MRRDLLLADLAVASDHERLGHAGRLVRARDRARGIVQDVEGEAILLHEIANRLLGAGIVDAHGHDGEAPGTEVAVQRLDARHLAAAGEAPRGPQVEQHDLAAIRLQRARAGCRIERARGERRRDGADVHRRQLAAQKAGDGKESRRHHEHDARHQHPLPAGAHAVSMQHCRSARTSAVGSSAANTA